MKRLLIVPALVVVGLSASATVAAADLPNSLLTAKAESSLEVSTPRDPVENVDQAVTISGKTPGASDPWGEADYRLGVYVQPVSEACPDFYSAYNRPLDPYARYYHRVPAGPFTVRVDRITDVDRHLDSEGGGVSAHPDLTFPLGKVRVCAWLENAHASYFAFGPDSPDPFAWDSLAAAQRDFKVRRPRVKLRLLGPGHGRVNVGYRYGARMKSEVPGQKLTVFMFWKRQVHKCPPTPESDNWAELGENDLSNYLINQVKVHRKGKSRVTRPVRFVHWPKRYRPVRFLVCGWASEPLNVHHEFQSDRRNVNARAKRTVVIR